MSCSKEGRDARLIQSGMGLRGEAERPGREAGRQPESLTL